MPQHLTDLQKGMIIGLKSKGHSGWYVQKELKNDIGKVSIRTINRVYKDHQENNNADQQVQRGRPRIINVEQEQKIRIAILRNKRLSIGDIQKSKRLNPNQASKIAIQDVLVRLNLVTRVAPTKPKISDKNIQSRIEWAADMSTFNSDEINKIIFTDESKLFCQKSGKNFVKVLKGSKIPQKYFRLTQRYNGGLQIMVWAAINFERGLCIQKIEERLNSDQYITILKENLVDKGHLEDNTLQHDNAAVHSAKKVQEYLNKESIEILVWPAQSPDMNPIENVWAWIKNELEKKKETIKIKDQLWGQVQRIFFSDRCSQLITKMYTSYQNRIDELIKQKGKQTKY